MDITKLEKNDEGQICGVFTELRPLNEEQLASAKDEYDRLLGERERLENQLFGVEDKLSEFNGVFEEDEEIVEE